VDWPIRSDGVLLELRMVPCKRKAPARSPPSRALCVTGPCGTVRQPLFPTRPRPRGRGIGGEGNGLHCAACQYTHTAPSPPTLSLYRIGSYF
jgi:hypothetical protein